MRWAGLCLATALSFIALSSAVRAQVGSARYSSIIVEARSGEVLEAVNADAPRHPASLTKMMTIFMTFEALRDRRIDLEDHVPVSAHAASQAPTKLGLMPGTRITVEQAILGLVTKSANDAAAALGEMLGGSEDRFAQMMTLRARALGMSHTTFRNASGLPDPDQWTTARDMALLGRRLASEFPTYYRYFSTPSFTWQGRVIGNHDHLLKSYPGADGLKTGYTDASGYNLVSSAVRGGVRLVGVVLGAKSNGERDLHMIALLNQGFNQMDIPSERPVVASRPSLISVAHAEPARQPPRTRVATSAWSVAVGSYSTEQAARSAARAAQRAADAGEVRIVPVIVKHKHMWRASVVGLDSDDAQDACAELVKRKASCVIVRPERRELASR